MDLLNAKKHFRKLRKQCGCLAKDLLALHHELDPFYAGSSPTKVKRAQWFADNVHRLFPGNEPLYLRRIHYRFMSQKPVLKFEDGKRPYLHDDKCWALLCKAAKIARYLGLIDGDRFDDKKAKEPRIYFSPDDTGPEVGIFDDPYEPEFRLPDFPDMPEYEFKKANQSHRYHVEVWTEKDTMEDILTPICEGMQVNLIVGAGELSKTSVDKLFNRIGSYEKPVRILYISDLDPIGQQMPVSISRKIEFNHRMQNGKNHITLYPIAVTAEQCKRYDLPRAIIINKKGKKQYQTRIDKFEEHHGEGGTELDALEAIVPGELEKIVRQAIEKYRDENSGSRLAELNQGYKRQLEIIQDEVLSEFDHRIDPLIDQYDLLTRRFKGEFDIIKAHIDDLKDEIREELEDRMPDFSDYEPPEQTEAIESDDPLYDSERGYMDQLNTYKRFQNKPEIKNEGTT